MVVNSAKDWGLMQAGYGLPFSPDLYQLADTRCTFPSLGVWRPRLSYRSNWPSALDWFWNALGQLSNAMGQRIIPVLFRGSERNQHLLSVFLRCRACICPGHSLRTDQGLTLTAENLTASLQNISFLGLTGPISFDQQGDRIGSTLSVVNFNGTALNSVGDCELGGNCSFTGELVFPGPTGIPPNTTRSQQSSSHGPVVVVDDGLGVAA